MSPPPLKRFNTLQRGHGWPPTRRHILCLPQTALVNWELDLWRHDRTSLERRPAAAALCPSPHTPIWYRILAVQNHNLTGYFQISLTRKTMQPSK